MHPRHLRYILNQAGEPVAEPGLIKWAMWMEKVASRKVGRTEFPGGHVSTVFLGLDHSYASDGPPILWETMVFGGPLGGSMDRCAGAREQAMAMHQDMVDRVNAILALQLPTAPDQFSQQPQQKIHEHTHQASRPRQNPCR